MTALTISDAAVRWAVHGQPTTPAAALQALETQPLLILMHGYGSNESDLISLAPHLPQGFVCASPRAPLTAPAPVVGGYSWFPIPFSRDGIPIPQPAPEYFVGSAPHDAALAMQEWIDQLDARLPSGLRSIALMGFSQGGAMVTSLIRIQPKRYVAGVNCSGFVVGGSHEGDAALARVRPPVFWGSDPADPIITQAKIALTSEWLPNHTNLEKQIYPGMAHSISLEEVADIHTFLLAHAETEQHNEPS